MSYRITAVITTKVCFSCTLIKVYNTERSGYMTFELSPTIAHLAETRHISEPELENAAIDAIKKVVAKLYRYPLDSVNVRFYKLGNNIEMEIFAKCFHIHNIYKKWKALCMESAF